MYLGITHTTSVRGRGRRATKDVYKGPDHERADAKPHSANASNKIFSPRIGVGVIVRRFSKLDTPVQFLASYSHLGFGWDRAQQKGHVVAARKKLNAELSTRPGGPDLEKETPPLAGIPKVTLNH